MRDPGRVVDSPWPCRRCGECCRVRGYVRLTAADIDALAAELGLPVDAFTQRYTCLTADRQGLSLVDQANGDCVFLEADASCRVQDAKPQQCRDFPLGWRYEGYERVCPVARDRPAP